MKRSAIVAAAILAWLAHTGFALDLVRDGRPQATLVLPDRPLPVEEAAAEELQHHLEKATGARLPIVAESRLPTTGGYVFLGACRAARAAGLDPARLPPNGYCLKAVGNRFFLSGDDSPGEPFGILTENRTRVGTLFAVYEFLEQQLGVRWLWPGPLGEVVPRTAEVVVAECDRQGKPPLLHTRWRDAGTYSGSPRGWADAQARTRYLAEQSKWLRRHRFAMALNMNMAHAFTTWWDRYGREHPDYFNLLPDGTRRSDPTYHGGAKTLISMSVGEPEFWRQIVAHWQASRTPQRPYIDASENDTEGRCVCAKCLALDVPDPQNPTPFADRVARAREAFEAADPQWTRHLGSLSDRYARYYLAVQREAQKVDPQAVVTGYAYANYAWPPLQTKLNDHIIIGIVPPLMFPWTAAKRDFFRRQWDGWAVAGARLFLRPNYMLDGHNLPVNFARALGEDFSYAASHGLMGTDFDSLTGQWAAQGPNLYVLARLHDRPDLGTAAALEEYYRAFGPACEGVRSYFAQWERTCEAVTDEAYHEAQLHWSYFYRGADCIFTPGVMAEGRRLLAAAAQSARDDETARQRVAFLEKGLRHAELTLAAQTACRNYKQAGDIAAYAAALRALDGFRAEVEGDFVANMGYLAWAEDRTWDRAAVRQVTEPESRPPLEPVAPQDNAVRDGGFEGPAGAWKPHSFCGTVGFTIDPTQAHRGKNAARIECRELGAEQCQKQYSARAWARWYQAGVKVDPQKTYRLCVWVKTSRTLSGKVAVWVTGTTRQTMSATLLNTQDQWRQVVIDGIHPAGDAVAVYLNLFDGVGSVWFDDVELAPQP